MLKKICCMVGCAEPACSSDLHPDEAVCAAHLNAASKFLFDRLRTACSRRNRVENFWKDDGLYQAVVASGRHLKLCDATRGVTDQVEAAWIRFKLDLLLADAHRTYAVERPAAAG